MALSHSYKDILVKNKLILFKHTSYPDFHYVKIFNAPKYVPILREKHRATFFYFYFFQL